MTSYAYRCQQLNFADMQKFLLQGVAWKNIDEHPLDKLLIADLKKEMGLRGLETKGKKKPTLEAEFNEIFQLFFKRFQNARWNRLI